MKILVVDGQGGSLGKAIIEKIIEAELKVDIVAVGTNSIATQNMIDKSGVQGATGENPVVVNAERADIIIGPIGIFAANSMFGEITERMTLAISKSKAIKLLIPYNKCNIIIAGTKDNTFKNYIDEIVDHIRKLLN